MAKHSEFWMQSATTYIGKENSFIHVRRGNDFTDVVNTYDLETPLRLERAQRIQKMLMDWYVYAEETR